MVLNKLQPKGSLYLFVLISIFGALLIGCSGRTVIDVNIDPTTGIGDIVIQPQATQPAPAADTGTGSMSQVVLFALVVALLIGTLAVVMASSRRRRLE